MGLPLLCVYTLPVQRRRSTTMAAAQALPDARFGLCCHPPRIRLPPADAIHGRHHAREVFGQMPMLFFFYVIIVYFGWPAPTLAAIVIFHNACVKCLSLQQTHFSN